MNVSHIYLDTNLWNRLLDQHISPKGLLESLGLTGNSLALSKQTVHELAKTFANNPRRGEALFQYIKQYLDTGIGLAWDVMEQLHLEVDALSTHSSTVDAFYGKADYNSLRDGVDSLANGTFGDEARANVESTVRFAKSARAGQNAHFDEKLDVKNRLQQMTSAQLEAWIHAELQSDRGTAILVRHLLRMYVEGLDESTAVRLAQSLLRAPLGMAAQGLAKAELYSNWRCAL